MRPCSCQALRVQTYIVCERRQVCSVLVDADGLSLRWEDDSKTLQSSIYLRSEVGPRGGG